MGVHANSGVTLYSQNLPIRQNRGPPHPAPTARDDLNKATQKPQQRPARSDAKKCPWSNIARSGGNLNIDEFLTFRLTRLSNALRTHLTKRYLEDFGLSIPEWRLLALVTRLSPVRFSELTTRSSMDKGQVSRTLQVMTQRGLTKMKVIKQRGSRSVAALAAPVIVSVAPKGKALYRQVLPLARQRHLLRPRHTGAPARVAAERVRLLRRAARRRAPRDARVFDEESGRRRDEVDLGRTPSRQLPAPASSPKSGEKTR